MGFPLKSFNLNEKEFSTYPPVQGDCELRDTMPNFQNPTGYSMSMKRKVELLDIAKYNNRR